MKKTFVCCSRKASGKGSLPGVLQIFYQACCELIIYGQPVNQYHSSYFNLIQTSGLTILIG